MAGLVVTTAPTSEPVSLAEARAHCRVDSVEEDSLLAGYVMAARQYVEEYTGRALQNRTYDLAVDWGWCTDRCGTPLVRLPKPPAVSVTSVSYVDANGATQTLDSSLWALTQHLEVGVVAPKYGASWPTPRCQRDAVTVRFVAGYGSDPIPEPIRQAILLQVGHFYANREAISIGNIVNELPLAFAALLSPFRVFV